MEGGLSRKGSLRSWSVKMFRNFDYKVWAPACMKNKLTPIFKHQPPKKNSVYNSPGGSDGKASTCNAGDPGSIPGSGRSPGERNGNALQYSCLENPMNGGA